MYFTHKSFRYASLLLIAILALILFSCGDSDTPEKEIIRPVKAMEVSSLADMTGRNYPATSQETSEALLSFRVSGPLVKLNAEEGQRVAKGDLIAEIDPRDFHVNLIAKEGRYMQAKAEMERYDNLYKKKSISKNELDIKVAAYLEAKSAYDDARNALSDTKLFAPYTSFVGIKFVENYEEVRARQDIVSLINLSVIEVKTYIPEFLAIQYQRFDSFEVEFETYPDKKFRASLKEIGKKSEAEGFPLTLYLDHNNFSSTKYVIAPGLTCRVNILLKDETDKVMQKVFIVPLTAIFENEADDKTAVWIVDIKAEVVHKRYVSLGNFVSNNQIQIIDGLKTGEWVVTAGVHRLVDGQKVKQLMEEL